MRSFCQVAACGIFSCDLQGPVCQPVIESRPLHWECGVPVTGPPEKPRAWIFRVLCCWIFLFLSWSVCYPISSEFQAGVASKLSRGADPGGLGQRQVYCAFAAAGDVGVGEGIPWGSPGQGESQGLLGWGLGPAPLSAQPWVRARSSLGSLSAFLKWGWCPHLSHVIVSRWTEKSVLMETHVWSPGKCGLCVHILRSLPYPHPHGAP